MFRAMKQRRASRDGHQTKETLFRVAFALSEDFELFSVGFVSTATLDLFFLFLRSESLVSS